MRVFAGPRGDALIPSTCSTWCASRRARRHHLAGRAPLSPPLVRNDHGPTGPPKEQIRKLLGHHSWEFTAGTYLHLNDDDLPDGDVLADLLIDQETQNEDKDEEAANLAAG